MSFKDTVVNAIKSPQFWGAFLIGQLLSFSLTIMNVTTKLLSDEHKINIPATQSLGNYIVLTLVFAIYTVFQYGISRYLQVIKERGLYYLVLSFFDVEASYFLVKGFAGASILSAYLINVFSSPRFVLYNYIFLKTPYESNHILGIFFAVTGMMLLLLSGVLTDKESVGPSLMGDLCCVIASALYAVSNSLEESYIHKYPNSEILGFLGLFGTIKNFCQLMILERQEFETINWTFNTIVLYIIFTVAMFCLYSLVPMLIDMTNATYYNISLLTSDFYGLIIGLFIFQLNAHPLYSIAFVLIVIGLLIYNMRTTSTCSNSAVSILAESEFIIGQKNPSIHSLPLKPSA